MPQQFLLRRPALTGVWTRIAPVLLLASVGFCLPLAPAAATPPIDEPAPSPDPTRFARTDVALGPRLVWQIRVAGRDGASAAERAERVRMRLLEALDSKDCLIEGAAADAVTIAPDRRGGQALYLYGRYLITVDRSLARAQGSADPNAVAQQWASRLRNALQAELGRGTVGFDATRAVAGLPSEDPADF